MSCLGDYATSTIVYGKFTTYRPSTGAPFTLAGTPALSVYKDNGTTQSTTGVALTVDFDSVTGLNHFTIDTSADGAFYSAGSNFDVVITTGTVDSISAVGAVVGRFTLNKVSALRPTTAGRTLDVSAGGEAGLDWANVGSPTTTVGLTNTTISTTQAVASVTGAVGSVTGSVGSVAGAVGSISGVTFPTNFGSLGINASGHVSRVVLCDTITTYTGNTPQTGDSFARIGAAGAGLTSLAQAATALSTATWTTARAGYLDSLNTGVTLAASQIVVKKNTALSAFPFLMVLASDHVTGATGRTVTATRSIDGGAFASCTNSPAEVSNGMYRINLSAADLNGNTITLRFTAATCDDTFITILTQP